MHNGPTRRTFGVCLVEEDDIARVIGRLQHAQSFGSNPLLLPIVLLSMSVHDIRSMQTEVFMECLELEETMGFDDENHEVAFDQMANFTRIPQRLNVLSSRLANTQYYCSCCVQALDCLEYQLQTLPDGYCTKVSTELQEQMIYFRVCSENIGFISKRGNTLVQSMTQTIHANLQQRDNQLNHRYGADMRTITTITLIFLPGTFVATFFSTTFWDFSPDNDDAKVTYWVYLYFVATISLTLLVVVIWLRFGALEQLTMKMVRSARKLPLLGRLIREKKVDDEELGKKGD
ncbi:uncharacterized protein J4E88_003771 [Alternaria novae-zelandiae]|uniref:uncharacterized protein n=1 Tax=Alternaria novae-zelandiae TaxID=430562 RepID=UPI0020C25F28|nr:uncharacterized protein J4E88_003771 [Alternaria novae-zelandiae]KAI4685934.1 hypothetical protein J4E88_003771 [Alternaria novae-zelandiae]